VRLRQYVRGNCSHASWIQILIDMEHYAGFWRRILASIIDSLLFGLISGVIHFLIFGGETIKVAPGTVNDNGFSGLNIQLFSSTLSSTFAATNWLEHIIIISVTIFMWVKFLGTPGKLITGCQVVDAKTRQAVTVGQGALRYVSYFVSIVPLFLGIFWIALDKRKQGFHDKIAGTVVIVESASVRDTYSDKNDESQKTLQQLMTELR